MKTYHGRIAGFVGSFGSGIASLVVDVDQGYRAHILCENATTMGLFALPMVTGSSARKSSWRWMGWASSRASLRQEELIVPNPRRPAALTPARRKTMDAIKLEAMLAGALALAEKGQHTSEECAQIETILIDVRDKVRELIERGKI